MRQATSPSSSFIRALLHTELLLPEGPFLDTGADTSFMDEGLAIQLRIDRVPLSQSVPASALDCRILGTVTHQTVPVHLLLSDHYETIRFYILQTPRLPFILGYPWLRLLGHFGVRVTPVTKSA